MNEWALPTIALLLMGYGARSVRLETTMVTQAMVFITLVLFTDAVRVNLGRLRRESLVPARLLGFGLPLTIVVGTAAGLALFPQLNVWTAAAWPPSWRPPTPRWGPVVTNRRLPSRIRQGLNVESGLDDGICVPC